MRKRILIISLVFAFANMLFAQQGNQVNKNFMLVIHGGAGNITKENINDSLEKVYEKKLAEVLEKGYEVLANGGTSIDAVEACIRMMEDSPLFNAGKGAVYTAEGKIELDASIMDGKTLKAGAVASLTHVKNPISLARKVMENSPHVMLIGEGAEFFAKNQNIELVDTSYFFTKKRWDDYLKMKNKIEEKNKGETPEKHGTVGVLALDMYGNLAAGTSTGGMLFKSYGRVGDTPVIGAGTYANNNTCAVSCTGHGEFFIRNVVAYDVSALMEYKKMNVSDAANEVVNVKLKSQGGEGGLIALDKNGNFAMPFNSNGMFRGYIKANKEMKVLIFR
ncbi:MAG: isoaspartyl peptidase/L-asparaginase [Bacteroidales bacterium]|nr:isoaspartyl peptidase/L-asparaginase [Bacteroidales bacterium]